MLTNLFYRKVMSKFLPDIKILFFRLRNFEKQIRRYKKRKAPCHKAFRIRQVPLFDKIVRKAGLIQFTTREIWPSGRRHFCAIQAFCRRQNLSAGGIHSRRACKIHCGIHKKDAGAKLYFTAVSEFQDITRNWVLD